jgi:ankyrin repeat protein
MAEPSTNIDAPTVSPPTPTLSTVGVARPRDLKQRDDLGFTRLHTSASLGDMQDVEYIIEKSEVNACSMNGSTPLLLASIKGHVQVMKLLLKHGAKTDVKTHSGNTPLLVACMYGHNEAVQLLLENGANRLDKNFFGGTTFSLAQENGHTKVMELLK